MKDEHGHDKGDWHKKSPSKKAILITRASDHGKDYNKTKRDVYGGSHPRLYILISDNELGKKVERVYVFHE